MLSIVVTQIESLKNANQIVKLIKVNRYINVCYTFELYFTCS